MEVSPILKLISSWTDLNIEVEVEDMGGSVNDPRVVQWPLERIKQRFEGHNSHPPIICPRLLAKTVPPFALRLNMQRHNNASKLLWLARQDPYLLSRLVLGQKDAILSARCTEFHSLVTVKEGSVVLLFATKTLEAEDSPKFEQNPQAFNEYSPKPIELSGGGSLLIPSYTLYSLTFTEDSLCQITSIVPHLQTQENMHTTICEVCAAIPFDKLPFEEDSALPHHESLTDLITSSGTCQICNLVLRALEDAQKDFRLETFDEQPYRIIDLEDTDGKKWTYSNRLTEKKFGINQIVQTVSGKVLNHIILRSPAKHRFVATINERDGEYEGQPKLWEKWHRLDDSAVRPWLYGNWWVLRGPKPCPYQLIGFGVRLSRMPHFQASPTSNVAGCVIYRGSDIRILTEPCNFTPFQL